MAWAFFLLCINVTLKDTELTMISNVQFGLGLKRSELPRPINWTEISEHIVFYNMVLHDKNSSPKRSWKSSSEQLFTRISNLGWLVST